MIGVGCAACVVSLVGAGIFWTGRLSSLENQSATNTQAIKQMAADQRQLFREMDRSFASVNAILGVIQQKVNGDSGDGR